MKILLNWTYLVPILSWFLSKFFKNIEIEDLSERLQQFMPYFKFFLTQDLDILDSNSSLARYWYFITWYLIYYPSIHWVSFENKQTTFFPNRWGCMLYFHLKPTQFKLRWISLITDWANSEPPIALNMSQKEFLEGKKKEKENGFEVATACWLHK